MNKTDFLRAIKANPGDPTPRLVYSDWLDDQGDPQGEFIRIQCELAQHGDPYYERTRAHFSYEMAQFTFRKNLSNNATIRQLKYREQALLHEHESEWFSDYPATIPNWHSRRSIRQGFVKHLTLDPQFVAERGGGLFEDFPLLDSLSLFGVHEQMPGSLQIALTSPVTVLDLSENIWMAPVWLETLGVSNSETLRAIRLGDSLAESGEIIEDRQLEMLASAPWFPRLERLVLCWDALFDGSKDVQAREEHVNRVLRREICLVDCCT